ncbi:hypothetical protein [Noviherbaspirillum galbum]|uniref:Uncharacterized protein n=1 Tax=Noviherbaspirillum galbum TaxID=2709383 RepID=A0A6B3SFK6_9BURK|nr:hypothetical protein [Noviherbaspirillum galbum]NEX59677.1 hypothetical protein [Noviherbaspirillum galbum]
MKYKTIDGGHPAPYPDMTDAQLYNYEVAFGVQKRTFDKPPVSARPARERERMRPSGGRRIEIPPQEPATMRNDATRTRAEPRLDDAFRMEFAADPDPGLDETPTLRATERRPAPDIEPAFDGGHEAVREDAPRHPRPHFSDAPAEEHGESDLPALDLSKPVRTITTKQPVEIITIRARHPVYKVHGYIGDDQVVTLFTVDGRISEHGLPFLENVPHQQRLYVNVYRNPDPMGRERFILTQHSSREEADRQAHPGRLACVPVEFDQ